MALLAELGIDTNETTTLLVNAPDYVLPDVAALKPRPAFASSLQTAEPTRRIIWWPERSYLTAPMVSRLRWMLETAAGEAWLLYDPEDPETVTPTEIVATLATLRLASTAEVTLENGDVALQFRAVNAT
jgi:hypothetical protein